MARILLFLGYIALVVYAVVDVAQHRDERPMGIPKWLWIVAIIMIPLAGAIAWLVLKYLGGEGNASPRGRNLAPDDDPEYLNWLEQQRRRDRRERDS